MIVGRLYLLAQRSVLILQRNIRMWSDRRAYLYLRKVSQHSPDTNPHSVVYDRRVASTPLVRLTIRLTKL